VTVAGYFEEKYRRLNYPNLQCVSVGPKNKQQFYPMEVRRVMVVASSNSSSSK